MSFIFRYLKRFRHRVSLTMFIKFIATLVELLLPFILEHIIDNVAEFAENGKKLLFWGFLMILTALACWLLNTWANTLAIHNAAHVAFDIRQDLFVKTSNLSGHAFDSFGLPSLTSRMTSDSYTVQQFCQSFQTMCIRAPFTAFGSLFMMVLLDRYLARVLCIILVPLFLLIYCISRKGIPMFGAVQERLDDVVRIMRENITGIRVVKALSKSDYEKRRFDAANREMMKQNIKAGTVMALPGPIMNISLYGGLVAVILIGARRVNEGLTEPGVILAFLTYFNLILRSAMGINRIFLMISKAAASAGRIALVVNHPDEQPVLTAEKALTPHGPEFIRFEDVSFSYNEAGGGDASLVLGGERTRTLSHISFALAEGESLGIIGPTGSGKSTIISLLLRFYDVEHGGVFIGGRDVRSIPKDDLRRMFGVVFQNDIIFQDSLRDNIRFGRDISEEELNAAVQDAMAASFIRELDGGLDFGAAIKGANLSGGQKQRVLISRALAGHPRILILDDSSSALDYKTDASLRHALSEHYRDTTQIIIAQRASSLKNMTHILVMKDGAAIGYGTHEELLESCPYYRDICRAQMGALQ